MTKSLKQIQKENRKFILEAIHGCSYEEALKKEIGFGCDIVVQNYVCGVKDKTEILTIDKSVKICDITGLFVFTGDDKKPSEIIEIIGKPLTLDRVLLAIQFSNIEIECDRFVFKKLTISYSIYKADKFDWDLTSETLEQQSEETQREINKIFTGE